MSSEPQYRKKNAWTLKWNVDFTHLSTFSESLFVCHSLTNSVWPVARPVRRCCNSLSSGLHRSFDLPRNDLVWIGWLNNTIFHNRRKRASDESYAANCQQFASIQVDIYTVVSPSFVTFYSSRICKSATVFHSGTNYVYKVSLMYCSVLHRPTPTDFIFLSIYLFCPRWPFKLTTVSKWTPILEEQTSLARATDTLSIDFWYSAHSHWRLQIPLDWRPHPTPLRSFIVGWPEIIGLLLMTLT